MLIIKPIQDKSFQRELCCRCGVSYDDSAFAYSVAEGEPDGKSEYYGICQFTLHGEDGEIISLALAVGHDDREALIIAARAAMSFVFRCGAVNMYIRSGACTAELIRALGFAEYGGRQHINLTKFYEAPCHYSF